MAEYESVMKAAENMRKAEESLKAVAIAYAMVVSLYQQALLAWGGERGKEV